MTTPTQGEHAQTEALRRARIIRDWCDDCRIPLPSDDECARLVAALTAQPAAPQGVAYAELPEPDATTVGLGAVWNRHSMRDFADRTNALRASNGQAPAGAWIERWYGSGGKDGYEGWSIVNKDGRGLVAYLGRNVEPDAVTEIVMAHNAAIAAPTAQAAPATDYDHGPQSLTVAEAARHVGKWLNERPNRPLDLRDVAMLVAHVQAPAAGAVEGPTTAGGAG